MNQKRRGRALDINYVEYPGRDASSPDCCCLFNSYFLACAYAASTDFVQFLQLLNGSSVALGNLRERVSLAYSHVTSATVALLVLLALLAVARVSA